MVFSDSINLAQRLTKSNEHDFVQEKMMDSTTKPESYLDCYLVSTKINALKELPINCRKYNDIVRSVQYHSKSNRDIAFDGWGNASTAAAKARVNGKENYAQIQRRYTNNERVFKKNVN
jgi:hypothetical protein